jgi:hypothetical protein
MKPRALRITPRAPPRFGLKQTQRDALGLAVEAKSFFAESRQSRLPAEFRACATVAFRAKASVSSASDWVSMARRRTLDPTLAWLALALFSSLRLHLPHAHIEQLCTVDTSPRNVVWDHSWTIEDEQCQKVGGGYAALKLRFLLFL